MTRDSYFDNYKALLILLVVIAHFIGPFSWTSHFMKFIITTIYFFHMPAFVFISAYFSKKNSLLKLVKTILIPYLIFQFFYSLLLIICNRDPKLNLLLPKFTLWFLLSLFCWRILIDKLIKIKGILLLSFLFGILIGYDTSIGAFAALGRTITYLPFFILGYTFQKEKYMQIANRKAVKIGASILLIFVFIFLFFSCDHIKFKILTMKYSYFKLHITHWGWLYRSLIYIASTGFIYLIGIVIPRQKHWYTYLGERTMSVYLLHGIIYKGIRYLTDVYPNINTKIEMLITLIFAILLTFFLSLRPFDTVIKKLSCIPIEKLLIINQKKELKTD